MPSLQVPPAPTPSALSKFSTRDKLLLAQAVHELGDEPPEWGKVASLMLAHPVVRDPTRLEEVQAAGITIGRVFGTRECERAWTALMRQRGLVLQPGEVGAPKNPVVEARNRKEARGAPPRTDKKSQLALAQLLYAERMEEIKESLRGKEVQYKNLVAYIDSLESGALDEILAEELRTEAINANIRDGRGERTRSGASSTPSLAALAKRGSANSFDVEFNETYGSTSDVGGSVGGSQDSSITVSNTGRKRRAAAAIAASNISTPGIPNEKEKEKDAISPGGGRGRKGSTKEKEKDEAEEEVSTSTGGNKRKRGGNENDQEGEGDLESEVKESNSSKKAKTDQDEGGVEEEDQKEAPSIKRTRSTRSQAKGKQEQEEPTEDLENENNSSRMSRTSLSPVSSRGGTKESTNTRTSSRLRRDSSVTGTGTGSGRNRGMSNASTTSNLNSKSDALSPTNTRTTRAGGGSNSGRNSNANSEKGTKENQKSEDRKRKEKVLLMLLQEVAGHRNANLFQDSVKEGDAPDYYSLIRHPIDLKQIKASIKSGSISSTTQLKRSLNQMFANALVYNREGTDVHRLAEEMRKDVEEILENHEK